MRRQNEIYARQLADNKRLQLNSQLNRDNSSDNFGTKENIILSDANRPPRFQTNPIVSTGLTSNVKPKNDDDFGIFTSEINDDQKPVAKSSKKPSVKNSSKQNLDELIETLEESSDLDLDEIIESSTKKKNKTISKPITSTKKPSTASATRSATKKRNTDTQSDVGSVSKRNSNVIKL